MSRMFLIDGKPMETWNVFVGCRFECSYCNARKAALTRFKRFPQYHDGFVPKFIEQKLLEHFEPGQFIFIAYMGDISFAELWVVKLIVGRVWAMPKVSFLFCTKNPKCYWEWDVDIPSNLYFGVTIETNRDYRLSRAPSPYQRLKDMAAFPHKIFLSIEPVMDFDIGVMSNWVKILKPEIVEVGADNYHHHLPEPSGPKLRALLNNLRQIAPTVVEKKGLERLLNNEQR